MSDHYFLSYSSVDAKDVAVRLADTLAAGPPPLPVWLDKRKLQAGAAWDTQVVEAIRGCRGLLFVMTHDSVQDSSVCKREWIRALKYKKPVIPLLFDPNAELPFELEPRQYIDFTGSFDTAMAQLRQHLLWMDSPEGVLQALRERLEEAERELPRAADIAGRVRIQQEVDELRRQLGEQQRLVEDPQAGRIPTLPPRATLGERWATRREQLERKEWISDQERHTPARIFLCYRREDTQGFARGIYERLSAKYGAGRVFRDIDSTPPGVKYSTWIESRVGQCSVMIVLIGNAWLSVDHAGRRRLDLPKDWVRHEIEAALKRDIPIIPVLMQGARMPPDEELPSSITDLTMFNAAEVTDSRWDYDIERLLRAIEDLTEPSEG